MRSMYSLKLPTLTNFTLKEIIINQNLNRGETPREMALTFRCRDAYELLTELEMRDTESIRTFTTIGSVSVGRTSLLTITDLDVID